MKITKHILIALSILVLLAQTACGPLKPKKTSAKDFPPDPRKRVQKNIEEGRGITLGGMINRGGSTNYEFSTSNPMWRATLDILDFLPLSTVDYSGGVIISDWYTDNSNKNQALKITVRFLSNTVQTNSLKVTVHKKKCSVNQTCNVELFKSRIQEELIASILKEAAILEKQQKK